MSMMSRISNKILIALAILIRCASTLENGTYDAMMFIPNDLQCLTQMPIGELMKIKKAIRMMHVVSDYEELRPWNSTESKIDNQTQSDNSLRELPNIESRSLFHYSTRFGTSTAESPLAEPFIMTSQLHETLRNNQLM